MSESLIVTEKLCKTYSTGGNQQHVLKNLDLTLHKGDFTVIMGASGSGKSTLLYALSGMDQPTLGSILFNNKNISKLNQDQLALFRRKHCGFVFQNINLLDHMSVLDNILASGLLVSKNKKEVIKQAKELLSHVGLQERDWSKFPSQLSGGEAQRVGIVRALINRPQIVFADEPTGALNSSSSDAVLDVLSSVNENGQSIVMVTHDLKTALRGNRVLFLRDGMIYGDLRLDPYYNNNREQRQQQLQAFLNEMGW
ncbi:ABC transporter ATP-binding protein [Paenibacillus septentrionalis]|uniref:ABC transporter ATP-binding protein n=1 Tax=Paenibacillus septentrionalis TaxID=429342 RepID=A0ABW1V655_9BACL